MGISKKYTQQKKDDNEIDNWDMDTISSSLQKVVDIVEKAPPGPIVNAAYRLVELIDKRIIKELNREN